MAEHQVCTRCVMDTTATEISFDEEGVCSFCRRFDDRVLPALSRVKADQHGIGLKDIADTVRSSGSGKPYDCVLGVSGGVDSAYLACVAADLGLRPLVVHVDTGWDSLTTVGNVKRLAEQLDVTPHVVTIDRDEMRDLQLAFYKAAVRNCEIPYDHACFATLYRVAASRKIPYILVGTNMATESVLPASWGHDPRDLRYIKSIYARHGTQGVLRRFPTISFWELHFHYPMVKGIRLIRLLNHLDYDKARAIEELRKRCRWEDYGGKHHEAISTRFFQCYYLPTKFGIDKRKAHLSNLILSGQLSREEAMEELMKPPCSEAQIDEDRRCMAHRLGVSLEEWDAILRRPAADDSEFDSYDLLYSSARFVKGLGLRRSNVQVRSGR